MEFPNKRRGLQKRCVIILFYYCVLAVFCFDVPKKFPVALTSLMEFPSVTIQFSHKWILSLRRSVTSPVLPYKVWFSTQKWKRRTRPPPSMKTPATLLRTAPARQKFVQRAINHHMVKILEPPLKNLFRFENNDEDFRLKLDVCHVKQYRRVI